MNELQLSTNQLKYLVAAAEYPTLKAAANRLQVSQPALSQGLSELERKLGVELFTRQGRVVSVTTSCIPILDYAKSVISQTQQLETWLESFKGATAGILRIGAIDTAATHYFSSHIQHFIKNYPDVNFTLIVKPSGDLETSLESGEIDAALMIKPSTQSQNRSYTHLIDEEIFIYSPDGHRKRSPQDWGPWVSFPKTSHTRKLAATAIRKMGSNFEVIAESHQPEVLAEMVRIGLGWAALPASVNHNRVSPLKLATNKPICARSIVIATKLSGPRNPMTEVFRNLLRPDQGIQ